jgi:hypothetical protein
MHVGFGFKYPGVNLLILKAIIEMVRHLRDGKGHNGLILANGGTVTYQHVICLSSKPRARPSYPDANPLPESLEDESAPEVDKDATGNVVIEVSQSLESCSLFTSV